jgi:murein DD-endopeptidase MepM/ murein hydrolase activator NlpD
LSAYAHDQTLLVKEDQTVRKGQKIAEMAATTRTVSSYIRDPAAGQAVDPAKCLPQVVMKKRNGYAQPAVRMRVSQRWQPDTVGRRPAAPIDQASLRDVQSALPGINDT